ncbi:hypothetical protein PC119_g25008, partial [Phytophthora cactorum]
MCCSSLLSLAATRNDGRTDDPREEKHVSSEECLDWEPIFVVHGQQEHLST